MFRVLGGLGGLGFRVQGVSGLEGFHLGLGSQCQQARKLADVVRLSRRKHEERPCRKR